MDILVDPDTGDVVYDNTQVTVTEEQRQSVAQKLTIKLQTFLGEWFLNTANGVPYYQEIFGKVRSKSTIDIIFREKISEEPDVIEITEFNSEITPDRTYRLTFRVRTSLNQITDNISVSIGA